MVMLVYIYVRKGKYGLNIVTYTAHARIQNVLSEGVQL